MARPIAGATISFGLVSIPVRLYPATQSTAAISFNLLHKKCGSRLKQQYICPRDNEIVTRDEMVKGYEFAKDQYVTFTPEELKSLEEKATQSIDIDAFVPLDKVDPIYFEKPYYLSPEKGGDKAYRLLAEAMRESGLFDSGDCLLPFPNDWFTGRPHDADRARGSTSTWSRMPANTGAVHIDPTEWNRNDGFSPGAMILAHVPGVDLAATGAPPVTDIGASLRPTRRSCSSTPTPASGGRSSPSSTRTRRRPANRAGAASSARRRTTSTGHRYIVALRNLKDADGTTIPATDAFRAYRDDLRPTSSRGRAAPQRHALVRCAR